MMRVSVFLFIAMVLLGAPLRAEDNLALKFGARESVVDINLSPNGQHVAYLQPAKARSTVLFIADVEGGKAAKPVMASDGAPWRLIRCDWASNTRLVCTLYGIFDQSGTLLAFIRLVAVNIDGKEIKSLGQRASVRSVDINQYDGAIIGWTVNDDGEVLMSRNYVPESETGTRFGSAAKGLGVDRINTLTLKSSREELPRTDAEEYIADTAGKVRIVATVGNAASGMLKNVTTYYYRRPDDRNWQLFSKDSKEEPGLRPVAVDGSQNVAYAFGKKDGRFAIYRITLDDTLQSQLVLAHDKVDVSSLLTLGRTGRVIGAEVVTDKREAILFDPEYKTLAQQLSKALPGLPLIQFVGASRNERRLLLYAGSDIDAGRYYIFDKDTKKLGEIMLVRPELEGMPLSQVKPVVYPAADGTRIPGYLTLPPGSDGKGLPALVIPHGGPSARDEWGFDWLAQYFAAKGFAVLQPNFRGSSGYGEDWYVENGFKSWRTAIGDVNDAGRWLVAQGIADKTKLAIFGWSYGGYAALQSGVMDPDLFKAVVAVAPVTDLRLMIDQAQRYTNGELVEKFIGSGEHIVSGSPRRQVGSIKAPVLLFSGDMDINVDIAQSRVMDTALRDAGKSSEFVVYHDLDHSLVDSTVRAEMLQKSSDFLKRVMGLK